MSRFDDEVLQDLPLIFEDAGDPADYLGASTADGILAVIDRNWEVYSNETQLAMRVTTISVMVSDVPSSEQGDTVLIDGVAWTVREIVEDDGQVRRLWVSR